MTKKAWTPTELRTLSARYPNEKTEHIAIDLGRSLSSVYQAALKQGLKKSADYLASPAACRTNGKQGIGARFKPGHATWNKGMKGLQIGGEATQFKPGSKPLNTLPIGSERATKDGILQRKVADTGDKRADWKNVHTLIWEAENGPVPMGCMVIFDDRNSQNFELANLVCVDRVELMRRNTIHRLPNEIAELCQLRGALNRQINQRSKP